MRFWSTATGVTDIVAVVGSVRRDAALIGALKARRDLAVDARRLLVTVSRLLHGRLPTKT
jgi:hypothetical protein